MLRGGGAALSRSSFALPTNAYNAAVALPVEILQTIFVFCAGLGTRTRQSRHGRAESALNNDVSKIRPQLDRDHWIAEFLQRSAYVPKHVNIDVGPLPPPVPCKKSHKRRRFGMSTPTTSKKKRRSARKQPLMALPSEAVEEVFSHASRIEDLHLQGNTVDVIRTLTSLGGSMPLLSCLSIGTLDEFKYPHFDSGDEDEREDPSLVLSETLFGGSAPRLNRLHFRSGLHVSFPSWVFRASLNFLYRIRSASSVYSPHWPDASTRGIESVAHATILVPASLRRAYHAVTLKHLSLLIIEDTFLELLMLF
ncbi:hypothetical protein BGY98DRAFT_1098849 [Russula aff. rugulosa BPL654]|nr:hypothetical protein BGY98DRAFT_1098849 [Russula aff. rugulosa BPL654]